MAAANEVPERRSPHENPRFSLLASEVFRPDNMACKVRLMTGPELPPVLQMKERTQEKNCDVPKLEAPENLKKLESKLLDSNEELRALTRTIARLQAENDELRAKLK